MKFRILVLAAVLAAGFSLGAQTVPGAEPQLAYRILMGYVQQKEKAEAVCRPVAASILTSLGALTLAGGASTWYWGDGWSQSLSGTTWNPEAKLWTSVGLGIGGAALLGTGILIAALPPTDFRTQFSDVFATEDPVAQNRLAAASLWSLAEEARNKRLVSAWVGILTPLATTALTVAYNVQNHKLWSENVITINSSQIVELIGGIAQLYKPSDEEFLYQKYQATLGDTRR